MNRRKAEVNMEGQFLVRQIYDDEITYGLIGAAVEILSKLLAKIFIYSKMKKMRFMKAMHMSLSPF